MQLYDIRQKTFRHHKSLRDLKIETHECKKHNENIHKSQKSKIFHDH